LFASSLKSFLPRGGRNEMSASQSDRINYRAEAQVIRRSILLNAPLLRVWNALATSEGLASWLMRNDFQPIVGTRFTFRAESQGDWNGVVECEVIRVDEPHCLAFTWSEASHLAPTLVTFELHACGPQTEVCLGHSGREHLPETFSSVLDQGWGCNMLRRLAELIERE
jgi:uncharacterized protein YndB with AHSA1/START domain